MELIGVTLGDFTIKETLGNGGMSTVYLARQTRLDRDVALKVLLPELTRHSGFQERFRQEAQTAAGLSHPNILTIYDYGRDPQTNLTFIAMELATGGTLAGRMIGPMEAGQICLLLTPICNALASAHERGIFHRDLKPSNILIAADGRPLLADFGLAFLREREGRITDSGAPVGSPAYMAPEQASGRPVSVDGRADQYALGILLYEMLTGQLPFQATTLAEFVYKHTQEPIPDPRLSRLDLPTELVEVVFHATAKSPLDRYLSITHFANALKVALAQPLTLPPHIVELQADVQALTAALASLSEERERGLVGIGDYTRRQVDLEKQKVIAEMKLQEALRRQVDSPSPAPTPPPATMASPFFIGGAVQDAAGFYGRRAEIDKILERLSKRSCTSIVGERRIGKSSLLLQVERRLPDVLSQELRSIPYGTRSGSAISIYLDLMQPYTHTRRGVMRAIRRRMEQAGVAPVWTPEEDGDLEALSFALDDWQSAGLYLVLLLDEVDKLTERVAEFDDLLETWRAAGDKGKLSMVTASRQPLADLCQPSGCSLFYNIFDQVTLGLLNEHAWQQLVRDGFTQSRVILRQENMAWIGDVAGGHPFYTQIAADTLLQTRREGTTGDIGPALTEQFSERVDKHMADLWRRQNKPTQAALKYLAGDTTALPPQPRLLGDLRRRGLIRGEQLFSVVWARGIREDWWER